MRKQPVTRDEVRLTERGYIATLPADSVRQDKYGLKPIPQVWALLVQTLKQAQDENSAWKRRTWGSRSTPPDPIKMPRPKWGTPIVECRHCGRGFYVGQRCFGTSYCSDKCKRAANAVGYVKARSESRAAERKDLCCERCSKKLTAQRSTARFCSVRCRVAAHRQAAASHCKSRVLDRHCCRSSDASDTSNRLDTRARSLKKAPGRADILPQRVVR